MNHLIIGAGPAATNAIETIRQLDAGGSQITLISDEPAHSRMALPYWLAGSIPQEHTHTGNGDYFQKLKVDARFGVRAKSVDPQAKTVELSDGSRILFDNLLIATGSSPLMPPIPGNNLPGVQPLWTLAHTDSLLQTAGSLSAPKVVLVGAGFIGFIVLNAMFKRKWQLAVVEREQHVLPRMLDNDSARMVERWLAGRGVAVYSNTTVTGIKPEGGSLKSVELSDGRKISADIVILATGIKANLDFLDGSGIAIDQGIRVNDRMQSNFPHVYAAGDVAQGPVLFSDQPAIHAIQPTAVDHGRIAGANMAGREVHYPGSLLMNVVDVCGLQCASFGNWNDAQAETMTICNELGYVYRKLLWRDDLLVGAIFAGRPNDMGMLTDVGMVKGMLQTQTRFGPWKQYLAENPFDIRRAYIALDVAGKLAGFTLIGSPSKTRQFRFGDAQPTTKLGPQHQVFVGTKS